MPRVRVAQHLFSLAAEERLRQWRFGLGHKPAGTKSGRHSKLRHGNLGLSAQLGDQDILFDTASLGQDSEACHGRRSQASGSSHRFETGTATRRAFGL